MKLQDKKFDYDDVLEAAQAIPLKKTNKRRNISREATGPPANRSWEVSTPMAGNAASPPEVSSSREHQHVHARQS